MRFLARLSDGAPTVGLRGSWSMTVRTLVLSATPPAVIPLPERTSYGYRIAFSESLLPHDAQQRLSELRYHIAADRTASFSVLIDVRGASGCPTWTSALITDALVWLQAHGMRRSAVLFDQAPIFLHLRSAAQTACVYPSQRYFNVSHTPGWEQASLQWLEDGVEEHATRRGEHLTELSVMLDGLSEGIMVCESASQVLMENAALSRLLAREIEGDRVRAAMLSFVTERLRVRDVAGSAAALVDHATTVVRTAMRTYRIRCTSSMGGWFGIPAGMMVSLEPMMSAPLDDVEVQSRFGLTNRELSVARLVAIGKTNIEIAELLSISAYTARNHVERILSKLRVRNRASVSAVLLMDVLPVHYAKESATTLPMASWMSHVTPSADIALR